jgi:kynurenine 3-monooxygenase
MARVEPLLLPMRGRLVHELSGSMTLHPYGQREHEMIYSVSRAALNRVLIEEACSTSLVNVQFGECCVSALPESDVLRLRNVETGVESEVELAPSIATDGAGSAVRAALAAQDLLASREDWLDHDYKELTIPPHAGRHVLDPQVLHIWPRRGFMLIALPNTDGSFTATLFAARHGADSFDRLESAAAVKEFFMREFPDATLLMPDLVSEFAAHPQGLLGTIHAHPWHVAGSVLLLGDAAHAIVPFHGQGMNAAFEDCTTLDLLLQEQPRAPDWAAVFAAFERARRANTESIAQMALENYGEMRAEVLDAGFMRRQALGRALEQRFPERFIPRYSMVMFHPEISYADAQRRGAIQESILSELDRARGGSDVLDAALAARLINERLDPLP